MKGSLTSMRSGFRFLVLIALLAFSGSVVAQQTPSPAGQAGQTKYEGFGDYLFKEADQIYITIDIFLTLVIAAYFLFLILRMADPQEKRVVGMILSLFLMVTLLPENNWLMNLLTETLFGESKVLGPDAIKNNVYNKDKSTNEVLIQVLLALQLLGKLFMIYNMFYLAALARGVKQGGGILAFIGLLAGVVLYNIQHFLNYLKSIGGVIGNVLNALFNA